MKTIMEKLHFPIIKVDIAGGVFTSSKHELGDNHLVDAEFLGLMNVFFSVTIDG